ncbi:MAG: NPCBM/NEW2 domain-containing protein [Verrucomicrobiae bacterium]|nr:NPCBM/NEW2 domain-containing protein [Verrucomicrobiae bacterium]
MKTQAPIPFWSGVNFPLLAGLAWLMPALASMHAASVGLHEMDLTTMTAGWGKARTNASITGKPLTMGRQTFNRGVGTHAPSEFYVRLDGRATWFLAQVGVDAAAGNDRASLEFIVYGDEKELWRSGVCRWNEAPRPCRVNLAGVKLLALEVTDAGDGRDFDHANWAEAYIEYEGAPPQAGLPPALPEERVLLTPPPPAAPRLNGPLVYGGRPGKPFLYRIPCTGERPITFAVQNLPATLQLDAATGILRGQTPPAGRYTMTITAQNRHGQARRTLTLISSNSLHNLALTPPMGWNSWYIHYHRVSEKTLREAADQMIASGMADFGYEYVNIDDCWMVKLNSNDPEIGGPARDAQGRLLPNKRFPDMRGMVDYIHAKGLKAGTYISPGPSTCAGYAGSYQHEALDARTFAEWGFDFLKYDWCSYGRVAGGNTLEHLKKPYQVMWAELEKQERDIVFNLCQYGMGEVWKWGGEVGHCWRTTGDLGLERGDALPGFYRIGLSNGRHHEYAGPGRWNDPDYILIGWVGDAHTTGEGKPTTLTPNEQYSYMSLWCLMAAPLIFSGDMAKLDAFTLNVLCNHEVIAVDQDPLGRQARIIAQDRRRLVMLKELADGARAVGLFNLSPLPATMRVTWAELGLSGPWRVRDLWRQKDMGQADRALTADIPRHGVMLWRLDRP